MGDTWAYKNNMQGMRYTGEGTYGRKCVPSSPSEPGLELELAREVEPQIEQELELAVELELLVVCAGFCSWRGQRLCPPPCGMRGL